MRVLLQVLCVNGPALFPESQRLLCCPVSTFLSLPVVMCPLVCVVKPALLSALGILTAYVTSAIFISHHPISNYLLYHFTNLSSLPPLLSSHHILSLWYWMVSTTSVVQAEREPLYLGEVGGWWWGQLLSSAAGVTLSKKDFEVINNVVCLWYSSQLLPLNWLGHTP